MKLNIIFAAALLAGLLATSVRASASSASEKTVDAHGHALVSLWKQFEAASAADRPQKMMAVLENIRQTALLQSEWWDWYDASREYVEVASMRDWKQRDPQMAAMLDAARKTGVPILEFVYMDMMSVESAGDMLAFVRSNAEGLRQGHNDAFYRHAHCLDALVLGQVMPKYIANDYEFALWGLMCGYDRAVLREAAGLLAAEVQGRYPAAEYLEYLRSDWPGKKSFAQKYSDKAVSLLAEQEILQFRYDSLYMASLEGQEAFKALREDCEIHLKKKASYRGAEKEIAKACVTVESLVEQLDAKDLDFSIKDGVLKVLFKNLGSARIQIVSGHDMVKGRKVFSSVVRNPAGSYFLQDTVEVRLPAFDDGEYSVCGYWGKESRISRYEKYTVSAAARSGRGGHAVFFADYKTGRPLDMADISIGDGTTTYASAQAVRLDGMTALPESIERAYASHKKNAHDLRGSYRDAQGVLHRSYGVDLMEVGLSSSYTLGVGGVLLLDRTVFKPGETVRFKAVLFSGDMRKSISPLEAGAPVKAELLDVDGKTREVLDLSTNDFGSVAGQFALPDSGKNGRYTIRIMQGGKFIDSKMIVVDDVVLPSFEIVWEESDRLYLKGDTITVKGFVRSYSGHAISLAKAVARILAWGAPDLEMPVTLAADGSFEISLTDGKESYYTCNLTVTDGTGETIESSTGVFSTSSIPLRLTMLEVVDGSMDVDYSHRTYRNITASDTAHVSIKTGKRNALKIAYRLLRDGKEVLAGRAEPDEVCDIALPGGSGDYLLEVTAKARCADGTVTQKKETMHILKLRPGDEVLDADVENVFSKVPSDGISFMLGTTRGPAWMLVEVCASDGTMIDSKVVYLDGVRGQKGSLETLSYDYRESYGDRVKVDMLYFKDSRRYMHTLYYDFKPRDQWGLPLEFTVFSDRTAPGAECHFVARTLPGVECALTVFDKSTEAFRPNPWSRIARLHDERFFGYVSVRTGSDEMRDNGMIVGHKSMAATDGVRVRGLASAKMVQSNSVAMDAAAVEVVEEEATPFKLPVPSLRENFAAAAAFEPMLRSDAEGDVRIDFVNCDKLSTFVVQLFAHNHDMHNAVLRREMVVTVPVKVALAKPQVLYEGDEYVLQATLSSMADVEVKGCAVVTAYAGSDYRHAPVIRTFVLPVVIPAGGSVPVECSLDVPELDVLGLKVAFAPEGESQAGDALFDTVPVLRPVQTLTEAHSAVLLPGADRAALVAALRANFVNVDASDAPVDEICIEDMLRSAVPSLYEADRKDVHSAMGALYAGLMAQRLDPKVVVDVKGLESKVLACRNADGGFGWFEGMDSSPVMTAMVLQRLDGLRSRGLAEGIPALMAMVKDAVRYLDESYFGRGRLACSCLSLDQYLYVRSMYGEMPFAAKSADASALRSFRKDARAYLVPSGKRGLNGAILAKARRMAVLRNLLQKDASDLWGLEIARDGKLVDSWVADMESLLEYAVEHVSGGMYYPDAVMPWCGLMDSELAAHAQMCDLMSESCTGALGEAVAKAGLAPRCAQVADGIRLWIMVQKETQRWAEDPAYVEALASVLCGSPALLSTRVLRIMKEYSAPFESIRAAGNGMSVRCVYLRGGKELREGDRLRVGDRVTARYDVWSEENRSFVLLSAARPACLQPVDQLSGRTGWWWRVSQCYRSVHSDRTDYWYEVLPEEKRSVSEEMFVTQKGVFHAPAVTIRSLYAPHYRANGTASVLRSE